MRLPKQVEIIEVGPRDGFQNVREFIETPQKIAIVDALYVEEGYRGKGIAKDLFRKFQEFASGCGAASIELKVMSRNRDALRLYASLGFCETKKYMTLPLSQNGSK